LPKIHGLPGVSADQTVANKLTAIFNSVNAQLGKLDPKTGHVIVAYKVMGFRPGLTAEGGVRADLVWITQPAACSAVILEDTAQPEDTEPHHCMEPATHVHENRYLCPDHAPEGAATMAEVLAAEKAKH